MEIVLSPIAGSPAKYITEFDISVIKQQYMKELSISVDKYLPYGGKISLYLCPDTGYRFYYPFTIFADADFYKQLQKASKNYYEPWKWENEEAAKYINNSDFLLDVGCGEGAFLNEMKKKGMQHLYGIDFAIGRDSQNSGEIHIENTTVEKFSIENAGKFDVITCFQVLEHITDVRIFIENCLYCLKKNGKLIIAVPNSHPYIYVRDMYHTLNLPPHHAGLWDRNALKMLCKYFPLEVISVNFQPIGAQMEYYGHVQIHYLSQKNILFKSIFRFSLFRWIYRIYLHLSKKWIAGHSQIIVYRKK